MARLYVIHVITIKKNKAQQTQPHPSSQAGAGGDTREASSAPETPLGMASVSKGWEEKARRHP